jgi:predicted enzyme related to lactoylglutathione lyase
VPLRAHAPAGAPCWADLQTSDTETSRAFYTGLFGWTAAEASSEFGGYFMFLRGGRPVAGCMPSDEAAPVADVWSIYLATDDVTKTLESAASHGGQVIVPAMPIADLGTMGFVVDASGAGIGLWQAGSFPGFVDLAEPGAPSWFELLTRDYAAAGAFYRDVFGWQTHQVSDTPELRYLTMTEPGTGDWLAGVMDAAGLPEEVPSHWSLYIGVEDADDAATRVGQLGGSVVRPPEDTPHGRISEIADPSGARLKIVAGNEAMPAR